MRAVRGQWLFVKWVLFAVVLAAVVWQGVNFARAIEWSSVRLRPAWLAAAVAAYLAGWLPAVWYWGLLLKSAGQRVPVWTLLRAYFCGHLGKYVPGKALVLVIRASMLRPHGVPGSLGFATAGYESLATMAAGGVVAAALAPFLLSAEFGARWLPGMESYGAVRWLAPLLALAGCVVGLPALSLAINLALERMLRREAAATGEPIVRLQPPVIGFLGLLVGWWLHGLSLGCTIQALGDQPFDLAQWPRWTAAASLATVLGFVVLFAPGGLGVREGVLLEVLAPQIGPQAVLAAGLLRLVWLAGEVVAAAGFYAAGNGNMKPPAG